MTAGCLTLSFEPNALTLGHRYFVKLTATEYSDLALNYVNPEVFLLMPFYETDMALFSTYCDDSQLAASGYTQVTEHVRIGGSPLIGEGDKIDPGIACDQISNYYSANQTVREVITHNIDYISFYWQMFFFC